MPSTRPPAVAGQFYPSDPNDLKNQISQYLDEPSQNREYNIRAVMVPHAAYIFSGRIASLAYSQLKGKNYKNIFLLSNPHRAYLENASLDNSSYWETPLGKVKLNTDLVKDLANDEYFQINNQAHRGDHVLEVQLPFLLEVFDDFQIIPILFGVQTISTKQIVQKFVSHIGDDDLLIISSDMSHYPGYKDANKIDRETLRIIEALDINQLDSHVAQVMEREVQGEETLLCGIDAVKLVMEVAKQKNWQAKILGYENSGDKGIADKNQVVGYGAVMFYTMSLRGAKLRGNPVLTQK